MTQEHPFTSFSFQDKHNMRFHCRLYRHASQWGGPYGDWLCDILELVLHHLLDVVNYPNPENCPQRQVSSVGNLCHGAILVFFPFPFAERVELGFSLRGNLLWIQFVPFSLLKCFCFFKVKKKKRRKKHTGHSSIPESTPTARFLNLNTRDSLSQVILCCGRLSWPA